MAQRQAPIPTEGAKFGHLICLQRLTSQANGIPQWRCLCVCGREIITDENMLRCGVIRSCGCRKGHAINLQGQVFGLLTCLEPLPDRDADGSIRWLCRCACGNFAMVSSNKLRQGHTTSCGCTGTQAAQQAKTYVDGTCVEILLSGTVSRNNTSGYRGVARKRDGWQAYINYAGHRKSLGFYRTLEDAAHARQAAEQQLAAHVDGMLHTSD